MFEIQLTQLKLTYIPLIKITFNFMLNEYDCARSNSIIRFYYIVYLLFYGLQFYYKLSVDSPIMAIISSFCSTASTMYFLYVLFRYACFCFIAG